jgi:hypothetical protein
MKIGIKTQRFSRAGANRINKICCICRDDFSPDIIPGVLTFAESVKEPI